MSDARAQPPDVDTPRIQYLNTDLDLVAPCDITPLTRALVARGMYTLGEPWRSSNGLCYCSLEVEGASSDDAPEKTIPAILDAIEALDATNRSSWDQCSIRDFNIGYDCGDEPWAFNNSLSNATRARLARVGGSLTITLYPQRPAEPAVSAACSK